MAKKNNLSKDAINILARLKRPGTAQEIADRNSLEYIDVLRACRELSLANLIERDDDGRWFIQ